MTKYFRFHLNACRFFDSIKFISSSEKHEAEEEFSDSSSILYCKTQRYEPIPLKKTFTLVFDSRTKITKENIIFT